MGNITHQKGGLLTILLEHHQLIPVELCPFFQHELNLSKTTVLKIRSSGATLQYGVRRRIPQKGKGVQQVL